MLVLLLIQYCLELFLCDLLMLRPIASHSNMHFLKLTSICFCPSTIHILKILYSLCSCIINVYCDCVAVIQISTGSSPDINRLVAQMLRVPFLLQLIT